jgi:hypothetical protein
MKALETSKDVIDLCRDMEICQYLLTLVIKESKVNEHLKTTLQVKLFNYSKLSLSWIRKFLKVNLYKKNS